MTINKSHQAPTELPGYELQKTIYNGIRTLVYQGISKVEQKPVVIKVLKKEYPTFQEIVHFRNQYGIVKNLDVAGIVQPIALENHGNGLALIMEDDGSISLSEELKSREAQNLSLEEFFSIAIQLAEILEGLYRNRVIHKDIKPGNILINLQTKQIKLIDFSIASLLPKEQQEIHNPNILEGTLAYISPEQTGRMNRGIDYRSDFYSLGVTFYQLLAGKLPFESNDVMELVHCHLAKTALPFGSRKGKEEIPRILVDIVMKLMAKNAEKRYQSALGLKYDLEKCWQQWQENGKVEAFELGERDICDRFLIPEKLYGRETEVAQLLRAFERVSQGDGERGNSELFLVAGFSGIGKTAVVNEVHKPITQHHGYFIKGKFDQFNRNIPLSAFVQALRDLMGQLLSESEVQLAQWRSKILEAVGENGQVLIEVIPELELIINSQPSVAELSGIAAQNRFNLLFQKFIAVFTTAKHPLVIFLDDLQWADSASLKSIELLMEDKSHLLLLGAYRDNEVSPVHPLMLMVEELKKAQAEVNTITLNPLTFSDTNQLVADTLNCSTERSQPLTELIERKTKGNPFFTTQFLKVLHADRQIIFNGDLGYWECDLTQLNTLSLTDDVVELMAQQLQKLPRETQQVLKLAACIGNQFSLDTLAIVSERSEPKTAKLLWKALQEGLILPKSEVYKFYLSPDETDVGTNHIKNATYRFLHDRVQQAAYSLIPEDQKQLTHYKIGKLLLGNLSISEREEKIFDVVNQINIGKLLLPDARAKKQLAELNLRAGQKAKASTAYEAAKTYLQAGIDLLEEDAWTAAYSLMFDLHFDLAEAALLSGNFPLLEETVLILLKFANANLDRAKIYVLKVTQYSLQGQFAESIQAGLEGLQHLGITVDKNNLPQLAQEEFASVENSLEKRSIAALLDLPITKNLETHAALELLINIQPSAYIVSNFDLYSFVTFRAVHLSIEQGNTTESVKAYVSYGFLLGVMYSQYQRGMKFADLALQLSYKLNSRFQESRACFMLGSAIQVWAKPIQGAAEINYQGFLAGLESGEIVHAGYNLYANILNRLFEGANLADIAIDIEKYWLMGEKLKNNFLLSILAASRFFVNQLLQSPNEQEETRIIAQQEWVKNSEALQSHTALGTYYILQMHRACLIQDSQPDIHYVQEAGKFLGSCAGFTTAAGYYYYSSLILLSYYGNVPEEEHHDVLQQIETNQAQLKIWSESCPENFLHKYYLIEAQRSQIQGKFLEALELYDRAISGAKENGYIQEQALGNELAAKFYLNWGKEKIAAVYMQEAYYCYAHWGAKAKVEQLQKDYPQLLTPILQPRQEEQSQQMPETLTLVTTSPYSLASSQTSLSESLDLSTVLKASQSLSQEIHLDRLLCLIMEVIVTNAGANEGTLLWLKEDDLVIAAHYYQKDKQCKIPNAPLEQYSNLPLSIINTVKRSQQAIIVNQSQIETRWANDPYLRQHQPQSCLCMPVLQQGKLLALLYLENQLTPGVFSKSRLEMLTMLTSQAAISLENAQLYQTLEEKVKQRTRELEAAQKQIISQEKLASLGALTAGVAHELRNPLNFVNNYAEGSVELATELIEALETPDSLNQDDFDYLQEIATDLKDNAGAIQKHGQRAERIIYNMMQHSRRDDNSCQLTDINKLLDEARQLAYHSRRSRDNSFNVTFATQYDESVGELEVFSASLNRAFINLIDNACYAAWSQYLKQGEAFVPQLWITSQNLGEEIEIRIRDNGVGIPSEAKEKVFEPFFTTKPTGEGTGLGLSLTHEIIVGQHGGTLRVESKPGSFTEFILILPKKLD